MPTMHCIDGIYYDKRQLVWDPVNGEYRLPTKICTVEEMNLLIKRCGRTGQCDQPANCLRDGECRYTKSPLRYPGDGQGPPYSDKEIISEVPVFHGTQEQLIAALRYVARGENLSNRCVKHEAASVIEHKDTEIASLRALVTRLTNVAYDLAKETADPGAEPLYDDWMANG